MPVNPNMGRETNERPEKRETEGFNFLLRQLL
jgi:hypothetical protein